MYMDNNDFVDFIYNKFEELKVLFINKHKQYGTYNPLANFYTAAMMNNADTGGVAPENKIALIAKMYEEAKNFQRKHIAHIQNNRIYGAKVAESLQDIAVYSVIMLYMETKYKEALQERKETTQKEIDDAVGE